MNINRNTWLRPFTEDGAPAWACPKCKSGRLRLDRKSLTNRETPASIAAQKDPGFDPDWICGVFACVFRCDDNDCGEPIALAGEYRVDHFEVFDNDDQIDEGYRDSFYPQFFSTAPDIFPVSSRVPQEVAFQIRKAFAMFWFDQSSSANRIRAALELMLTHKKVKRFAINRRRKRRRLSLNERIILFADSNPEFGESLMAIKWIGNAGSHVKQIAKEDLLDVFEILHNMFEELYDKKSKRLQRLKREINKKRGPRSKS